MRTSVESGRPSSLHHTMDSSLSYLPVNPASLVLIVLGISLLDYMFNCWSELNRNTAIGKNYKTSVNRCLASSSLFDRTWDAETPNGRICGLRHLQLRHRVKLMAGVKRRLDQDF
ncbi:uncharacterized protein LOC113565208 [Drosophila persimilis]|uniref:uncharacterized protein LOC113565208 n=1 Tax=Drosophila persimilis TaxID=7234 RepID=UPI000F088EE4|nr:uncharacterized protein LOC113565208 [Drosophila persimilis]